MEVELPQSPDGKRRRKYIYGDTRQECSRLQHEFIQELDEQKILNNKDITVAQYFNKWLEINCDQLSPTTYEAYSKYVKMYITPSLGAMRMIDVLQMHIQELINDFSKTHRSKSCSNLKGIINKAFNDARTNKIVKSNPCVDIKIKRSQDYEYYIYDEAEFNKLLGCVKGTIEEIPIILAALCGMRAGEVMGLMWENVNFDANEIKIIQNAVSIRGSTIVKEPKTYSSNRVISVPEYVMNVLKRYRKEQGYVYPKKNGNPENVDLYRERFLRILKENNLPRIRFHDLRHFNATMMLKLGISDKEASGLLGHTNVNMTKKYQHVLKSMKGKAAEKLNTIVRGDNGGQNGGNLQ